MVHITLCVSDAASYGHMINGQMENGATSKIKVCVRIRPLLRSESESSASDQEVAWKWSDQHIIQDKFLTAAQAHAAAGRVTSEIMNLQRYHNSENKNFNTITSQYLHHY